LSPGPWNRRCDLVVVTRCQFRAAEGGTAASNVHTTEAGGKGAAGPVCLPEQVEVSLHQVAPAVREAAEFDRLRSAAPSGGLMVD
jgi:hypothetical protein